MIFDLPTSLDVNGAARDIDSDYRQVLRILQAFEDPDLSDAEKAMVAIYNLYVDAEQIPAEDMQAAFDAALSFIDCGGGQEQPGPRTMDWAQDAPIIFPAVNRAAGFEVRGVAYMHWWTFVGYFMEIRDSTCATVLGLRQKKARGKKLEKFEKEFWQQNRGLCELKRRLTEAEREEDEYFRKLLG